MRTQKGEIMSVNAEQFRSEGGFAACGRFHPGHERPAMFHLECHSCGFEPPDAALAPPPVCPKCHGGAWERYARPGSILEAFDHASRCGPGHRGSEQAGGGPAGVRRTPPRMCGRPCADAG